MEGAVDSQQLERTYGEKVRTVTDIPKTGRRDPPVEASNSVLSNDFAEHHLGGYRRK